MKHKQIIEIPSPDQAQAITATTPKKFVKCFLNPCKKIVQNGKISHLNKVYYKRIQNLTFNYDSIVFLLQLN